MIRGSDQTRSIHRKTVTCANCGSTNVSTSMETDRFAYGAGADAAELSAVVPVHSCAECGTQFTDEEAERLRHETVCRHLGRLTPSEIRDIRIQYGMRRADFAAATRLGEATLARWESGAMLPNAAYDQYLRLLRSRENMTRVAGSSSRPATTELPSNVVPFPRPRLRAIANVPPELARAEKSFQLHR